jgi:N-acetylglucosamine transport system permease protein
LWSYVYHPNIGLLNGVLGGIGLDSLERSWLGNPTTILWAIVAVMVWSIVGFYMVIYIAAMQSIPTSFYEAAILDGANRWRCFRDITFPLIWETIRTTLIYIGILALDAFVLIQVMTGGGVGSGRRAEVAALYLYQQAFDRSRWGYASAIGVILLVLTLILSVVIMRLTKRETYEF